MLELEAQALGCFLSWCVLSGPSLPFLCLPFPDAAVRALSLETLAVGPLQLGVDRLDVDRDV